MQESSSHTVDRPRVVQSRIKPVKIHQPAPDTWQLDFGQAMFATLAFTATCERETTAIVALGEMANADGSVRSDPPGTIRYLNQSVQLKAGEHTYTLLIPDDQRNTGELAIHMPREIGQVLPFRYASIHAAGAKVDADSIIMLAAHVPFDDSASHFECDNAVLNDVWEMCKHTIKATSFCGVYVDGDRERIPYEGDAYINQLCHYCVDSSVAYQMARYSHEYLIEHPTWFTDWLLHSVLMAWADYMYTGSTDSLKAYYDDLCAKTLIDLARSDDGLISTHGDVRTPELDRKLHFDTPWHAGRKMLNDLVDWPPGSFTQGGIGERDNHEMLPVNTVVNALHYRAVDIMAAVAKLLGKTEDAKRFEAQAARVRGAINEKLFDEKTGRYIDGLGEDGSASQHSSLHANMFPLAMGLVPEDRIAGVVAFIKSRGMACSVYGAQHLLEGLYDAGEGEYALSLMAATHDRSWHHMIVQGSTVALEAWAHKYKNNLDWNHAWGAAPGNIIPRQLMGVQPLSPGFDSIRVKPQPGHLRHAKLRTPTPHGPVEITWQAGDSTDAPSTLTVEAPANVKLHVDTTFIPGAQVNVTSPAADRVDFSR